MITAFGKTRAHEAQCGLAPFFCGAAHVAYGTISFTCTHTFILLACTLTAAAEQCRIDRLIELLPSQPGRVVLDRFKAHGD